MSWTRGRPGRRSRPRIACGLALTATDDAGEEPFVEIYGAMVGSEADLLAELGELVDRAGSPPREVSQQELGYDETALFQAGLLTAANTVVETPEGPVERQGHRFTKSEFFAGPIPREGIAELVRVFASERSPGDYRGLEFAPWGGAYARVAADASAFAHRSYPFSLKHAILVDPEASDERKHAGHRWVTRSWASVHPWGSGAVYPNFPDPDIHDYAGAYFGANLARLQRVKRRYDPDGFFSRPQPIPTG